MEETQGAPAAAADETTGALGAEAIDAGTVETTDATPEVAEPVAEAQQDGDAAISEAEAADAADLEQYPESVREKFKALDPSERKALYEEAEKRAEARITANQERLAKIEAEQKAQEARRAEIRSKIGEFVGAVAQKIELPNGNVVELPPLAEMEELAKTQRGRDQLAEKYGMDDASAEFWRAIVKRTAQAIDASAEVLDDAAWGKLDANLRAGIKDVMGIEPDTILSQAKTPTDVVKGIVGHFEGQIAQLKKEHEARTAALNVNAEALRGRAVAGSARVLATGGRSAGGGSAMTLAEFQALPLDQKQKMRREDPAGVDRIYARG